MSEMKRKQGGNGDDAPRCPPHHGFVGGLCFLCGAKVEDAEGGAPGVAVGQGGGGHGNDARCVKEEDTEGGAPRVAVRYWLMKEEDDDDDGNDDAARCPPHPPEKDAGGSASGVTSATIGEALVLPDSAAATSIASASAMATLKHEERKLILVVDLDHTLLNSTMLDDLSALEQRYGLTPYTKDDLGRGLFRLEYDNVRMLVKMRPFVGRFLEEASSMFEMHVYTLGIRAYAKAVIDLLDREGVFFGGRVVSREESTQWDMKSLDVIPGADPAAVVILDDTDGAWPPGNQDNLILMDRYHYFASTCRKFGYNILSLAERDLDERVQGCSLAVVLSVLKRVHQDFFDGDRADIREVMADVRRQVLPGCTVAFSFLEQAMEDSPEDSPFWALAERLGAVCRKDVDETVTHVVAEDTGTQKAQWAREHGKFLVDPEWIKAASFRWCRQDEREFPVTARAS